MNGAAAGPRSRSSCTRALRMKARLAPNGAADAEVPGVDQAVVARVGLVELREPLRVRGVVEAAAVDDHAADRGAVAAEVLGRRVHDHVGAPLQRADQVRRGHGVVDDQRHPDLVRHGPRRPRCRGCRASGWRSSRRRTPWCSAGRPTATTRGRRGRRRRRPGCPASGTCSGTGCRCRRTGSGWTRCATRLGHVQQRQRLRRLPGRGQQRADAALQRREPLLDHVGGRVHDPGVDVAELLQGEEVRGVVGVVEDVRRGLVDRQRPGSGGGVRLLAGVDLTGLEGPTLAHVGQRSPARRRNAQYLSRQSRSRRRPDECRAVRSSPRA